MGEGRYGVGERGVELRILIQKPGVRHIIPPPSFRKVSWFQEPCCAICYQLAATLTFFSSLKDASFRENLKICTRRFSLADEYPRSLQNVGISF